MAVNSVKMYISERNLIYNMDYLTSNFNKEVIAVVKSNAYGHDLNLITKTLHQNGYKDFAVARLTEAEKILLNPELSDSEILIFESIGKNYLEIVKNNPSFQISINVYEELEEALEYGIPSEQIQLSIDFGFGRNGISLDCLPKLKEDIEKYNLKFAGIYSHLFSATYEEGLEIIKQFTEIVNCLGKERFKKIHLQGSAAVESYGSIDITTHIRIGTLIYGLQEDGFYDRNLKQVFSLEGQIAGIRNLENSRYLAYNLKSDLEAGDCKHIAKVKIGYGDGLLKINERTKCVINNKEYKITLITMDNSFIETDSSVEEGDKIIFYPNISVASAEIQMKNYEILAILSPRIERVLIDKISAEKK